MVTQTNTLRTILNHAGSRSIENARAVKTGLPRDWSAGLITDAEWATALATGLLDSKYTSDTPDYARWDAIADTLCALDWEATRMGPPHLVDYDIFARFA